MMNTVTNADIERSYTTLALLDVCLAATSYMEDQPDNRRLQGSLVTVFNHMTDLVGKTHDVLESLQQQQDTNLASASVLRMGKVAS